MEREGDVLIDLISIRMLGMHYRHRQSASDCLREMYQLFTFIIVHLNHRLIGTFRDLYRSEILKLKIALCQRSVSGGGYQNSISYGRRFGKRKIKKQEVSRRERKE